MTKFFAKAWPENDQVQPSAPSAPALSRRRPRYKRWWRWLLVLLGASFGGAAVALWWFWDAPLLSPLTSQPRFEFLRDWTADKSGQAKVVYGYLPYWNVNNVTLQPELTHLSYFGLTVAGDGSIVTRQEDGGEPGYARLQSDRWLELNQAALAQGTRVEIVLAQFNNDAIASLLTQPSAHDKLITSLDSILLAYPVSGINIDIEYTGEITPAMRAGLVQLMAKIRQHLDDKYDQVNVSIAMYASAADTYQIWDVPALAPYVDYIVVMAYDFHRRSSPLAGPVAPLFGGRELWDSDISQHLASFLKVVPSQKVLLGVPFYGYEWQTISRQAQAHTFPDSGSTASFKRVQEILSQRDELQVEEHWNETALSPYVSYIEDEETFVIYYENSRSLSYKLDYVNQLGLGGIAIWALGYEGDSRELWEVINRKLAQ